MINIHDPVAGKSYVLDPAERTAREIRPFQMAIAHAPDQIEARKPGRPGSGASRCLHRRRYPHRRPAAVAVDVERSVERDVTVIRRRDGGGDSVQVFSHGAPSAPSSRSRPARPACTSPPRISASKCSRGCS